MYVAIPNLINFSPKWETMLENAKIANVIVAKVTKNDLED